MKEKQNYQKESEQLGFLYETTKEIAKEKNKDLGKENSFKSNEEKVEILSKDHFPRPSALN